MAILLRLARRLLQSQLSACRRFTTVLATTLWPRVWRTGRCGCGTHSISSRCCVSPILHTQAPSRPCTSFLSRLSPLCAAAHTCSAQMIVNGCCGFVLCTFCTPILNVCCNSLRRVRLFTITTTIAITTTSPSLTTTHHHHHLPPPLAATHHDHLPLTTAATTTHHVPPPPTYHVHSQVPFG
jgi:hypothetical protein